MRVGAVLLVLGLGGTLSAPVRADPAPAASEEPRASPKRAVPDYDGRGPEAPTVGDELLWIPRILLSPLYLVTEYVIRWPLSVVVPAAERIELPRKLYDFFTFGPEHKAGFFPVGYYDFGFNPSVGVYAFWNDAGFRGNDWHVHVEAWPSAWLAGSLTDRIQIDGRRAAQFRVEAIRRPDHVFYGIGPDTPQSAQSRYGEDRVDGGAQYEWRFWRGSRIEVGVGLRATSLYDGSYGDDPGTAEAVARGTFPAPVGFGDAYSLEYNRGLLVLDTRRPAPWPGSGLRASAFAEQDSEVGPSRSGWVRYGGSAGAYLDLNGHRRVVGLSAMAAFADRLGESPIPFTELVSLGGDAPMRGYYAGRLVDSSAVAATARYTWPVGPWLNGAMEASVGNVFDDHLRGFRPGRLRFSGDIALSTEGGDYPLQLGFGVGSETFEHGGEIDAFRATVSVNHGF